jgi:hypothetical protein
MTFGNLSLSFDGNVRMSKYRTVELNLKVEV